MAENCENKTGRNRETQAKMVKIQKSRLNEGKVSLFKWEGVGAANFL